MGWNPSRCHGLGVWYFRGWNAALAVFLERFCVSEFKFSHLQNGGGCQKIPFKLISSGSDILKWYESNKNSYHFLILTTGGRYCQKCTVFESGYYFPKLKHRHTHMYTHVHIDIDTCTSNSYKGAWDRTETQGRSRGKNLEHLSPVLYRILYKHPAHLGKPSLALMWSLFPGFSLCSKTCFLSLEVYIVDVGWWFLFLQRDGDRLWSTLSVPLCLDLGCQETARRDPEGEKRERKPTFKPH